MRSVLLAVLIAIIFGGIANALTLDELWSLPTGEVSAQTVKAYSRGSLKIEKVLYQSRPYKGSPVKIFGYYVYPGNAASKLPAILLVHGGGGTASLSRAASWARRGYAVLTIDLPGKGEKRYGSRSTGPDMDVPVLLRTKPDPSYNYLIHAVAAARNGITYLTQRKEVDPARIGMVGLSWGGVVTLLTNGQDKRLKTAVNVFGAGYIPEGCTWQDLFDQKTPAELAEWYDLIDPKNFLRTQNSPIYFITGTNDHCYYLPIFQKSYLEATGTKDLYLVPNLRHQFFPDTAEIVLNWLSAKLKSDRHLPQLTLQPCFIREGKLIVPVTVTGSFEVKRASLYYSPGAPSLFTSRKWLTVNDFSENSDYFFAIPLAKIKPEVLFYLNARDVKGGISSTPVRSIFKVKLPDGQSTYAVSSPIVKTYFHATPLQFIGITAEPQYVGISYSKAEKSYSLIKP